jgi:hypothetical protein
MDPRFFSFPDIHIPFAVWIVSNEQLLDWVQHPVPTSQLDQVASLKCSTPQVDASTQICNGMPQNEAGLLGLCDFSDFPFYTCVCSFLVDVFVKLKCFWVVWMSSGGTYAFRPQSAPTERATNALPS